jgi:hypothetical protein
MKRTLIAFAAAAGLSVLASRASADPGGFAPPAPGAGAQTMSQFGGPGTIWGAGDAVGRAPDRYGWNPLFKRVFRMGGGGGGCGNGACGGGPGPTGGNPLQNPANWGPAGYGMGGPAYNPNGFPPGPGCGPGPMQQGTLVFPHHPYVRSPRDYFMMDLNK